MLLSSHFSLEELTNSEYAIRRGVDNTPSIDVIENLKILCAGLERVRSILSVPIHISSGYRSPKVNAGIGSKPTSAHVKGLAADFTAPDFGTPQEIVHALIANAEEIGYDQVIEEFGRWVHIGFSDEPRMQALSYDGKTYTKIV